MSRRNSRPLAQRLDLTTSADSQPTDDPTATPEPDTAPSYNRPEAAATVQTAATQALQERFGFDLTTKPKVEVDPELLKPEEDEEED